uniref:Uncharacterized protein n=1 Tax=Panagrolaimus sp. PS1159 TaxID=55785 RepID=A0AC35GM31_9BILA
MKVFYILLITIFVSNCLISEFEAKKVKHEKIKAEKVKIVQKNVKPAPDQPCNKETATAEPQKVLQQEKDDAIEEVNAKKSFNRKQKTLSEYKKCKYECKRKRDQISAKEYVEQLTQELKLAKEYLASQEREAPSHDAKNTITQDDKIELPPTAEHLEDIPTAENPILNLHQTVKDEI